MASQITKHIVLVIIFILLSTSTFSQPANPGLPPFNTANTTASTPTATTQTTNTTATATSTTPSTPTPTTSNATSTSLLESQIDDLKAEITSLKSQLNQQSEPTSFFGYFIFLFALDLLIIAAVVFLFLKHQKQQNQPIPDNIKNYVKANLQRGYQEGQIRLQLANQGWKPEKITQIFDEVHHGL